MKSANAIPFRLRIGVTGHRELADPEAIARKVKEFVEKELPELYDDPAAVRAHLENPDRRTEIVYTVITPLAEGADRLVAHSILNIAPASRLRAVLPFPREEYLKDFASEASRREFESLYQLDADPLPPRNSLSLDNMDEKSRAQERSKAYLAAGILVVEQCDLLIAVWDGEKARGKGGTAEIIAYAEERGRPLVKIFTSGRGNEINRGAGLKWQSLNRIEEFNAHPITAEEISLYTENVYNQLFANPPGAMLDPAMLGEVRSRLLPGYARASIIAKHNRKLYHRAGQIVYLLSPVAVLAVAIGVLFRRLAPYALALEALILILILLLIFSANRMKVLKKWIENRALAEHIRAGIFTTACGFMPRSLANQAAQATILQSDDWIMRLLNEMMSGFRPPSRCSDETCSAAISFVRTMWIDEQIAFHANTFTRSDRISRFLERAGMIIFLAAIAAAIIHLLTLPSPDEIGVHLTEKLIIILAIVLPAAGASIGGFRTHGEYSRLAKRSQSMKTVLTELRSRFVYFAAPETLAEYLREIESVMLEENKDWIVLMGHIELSPV